MAFNLTFCTGPSRRRGRRSSHETTWKVFAFFIDAGARWWEWDSQCFWAEAAAHDQWQVKRCRQQKKRNMIKEENFVKQLLGCPHRSTTLTRCNSKMEGFFWGKKLWQLFSHIYSWPAPHLPQNLHSSLIMIIMTNKTDPFSPWVRAKKGTLPCLFSPCLPTSDDS